MVLHAAAGGFGLGAPRHGHGHGGSSAFFFSFRGARHRSPHGLGRPETQAALALTSNGGLSRCSAGAAGHLMRRRALGIDATCSSGLVATFRWWAALGTTVSRCSRRRESVAGFCAKRARRGARAELIGRVWPRPASRRGRTISRESRRAAPGTGAASSTSWVVLLAPRARRGVSFRKRGHVGVLLKSAAGTDGRGSGLGPALPPRFGRIPQARENTVHRGPPWGGVGSPRGLRAFCPWGGGGGGRRSLAANVFGVVLAELVVLLAQGSRTWPHFYISLGWRLAALDGRAFIYLFVLPRKMVLAPTGLIWCWVGIFDSGPISRPAFEPDWPLAGKKTRETTGT